MFCIPHHSLSWHISHLLNEGKQDYAQLEKSAGHKNCKKCSSTKMSVEEKSIVESEPELLKQTKSAVWKMIGNLFADLPPKVQIAPCLRPSFINFESLFFTQPYGQVNISATNRL